MFYWKHKLYQEQQLCFKSRLQIIAVLKKENQEYEFTYSNKFIKGVNNINKLIVIGEALIDFIPLETGIKLKQVSGFIKSPGGAPANVAACVKRLGGEAQIITKLGEDAFGDFLLDKMNAVGIDCSSVYRTDEANTALAFVSLMENGERDFSFYRNPSADMLLQEDEIKYEWFNAGDILHFCSVDLIDAPVKRAHDKAISYAKEKNMLISFDPNVRLPLWKDHKLYKEVINEYIDKADILKISDNELAFITGIEDKDKAINSLLPRVKLLLYTKGADGAEIYYAGKIVEHSGFAVKALDTTGAGDTFIGTFIFSILMNAKGLEMSESEIARFAEFSNGAAAIVTSRKGAIDVMPTYDEVTNFINK